MQHQGLLIIPWPPPKKPSVTYQLKALSEAGPARGERRGTWIWSSLNAYGLGDLRSATEA
jgi:hypothetical protein